MQQTSIVLGLQYGDEGKGSMTAFLAQNTTALVVRFNGGQQAGHTVVKDGHRHIFATFGSGTLSGADTFVSQYCTFYPKSYVNERNSLRKNGYKTEFYIHPLAMVTTPFDIDINRAQADQNKHGSVGMGFGTTIHRNETSPHKLYVQDLFFKPVLLQKLRNIAAYYNSVDVEAQIADFMLWVGDTIALNGFNVEKLEDISGRYNHIIFEGAQGIMLDMDFGFFPNVTRSNTTSKNAMQLIKDACLPNPQVYYCMRSYLTRHGNGPFETFVPFMNFEDKTNLSHRYQGEFKQGYHLMKQLRHAISIDCIYSGNNISAKNLFITCLDQTDDLIYIDGQTIRFDTVSEFILPNATKFTNHSPNIETIKIYQEDVVSMSI